LLLVAIIVVILGLGTRIGTGDGILPGGMDGISSALITKSHGLAVQSNRAAADASTPLSTPGQAAASSSPNSKIADSRAALAAALGQGTAPIAPPAGSIDPSAKSLQNNEILQILASAEVGLKTGTFEVSVDYAAGSHAASTIAFDLGDDSHPSRFHVQTTYESNGSKQGAELVIVGTDAWERLSDGTWVKTRDTISIYQQVRTFLPDIARLAQQSDVHFDQPGLLRWHDPSRSVDLTLQFDPLTGVPLSMRQAMNGTGAALNVTYDGWNTDVDINVPKQ
jgi:hypothetical protein